MSVISCPKFLEAATEDVDDGRDAVTSTASMACIFTTGPDTRPLLAHPSLLCRCSLLCMYAYVVRTVEHLHAGQACRTYFRYHISAQSGRVIDSTRISPHVSLRAQFHQKRNIKNTEENEKSCSSIDESKRRPSFLIFTLVVNVLLYRLLGERVKKEEEGKSSWTRFTATTTTITSTTPPHRLNYGFMGIEAHCFLILFSSTSSFLFPYYIRYISSI